MQQFNIIPKTGTYGSAIDTINLNFTLASLALSQIHDGRVKYAATDAGIVEQGTIYCIPDPNDTNVWHEKMIVNNTITTLATHSGSLDSLADLFAEIQEHDIDDFAIKDESGFIITRFRNGDIMTKNFDSAKTAQSTDSDYDFAIQDENGKVIFALSGGHIKTKYFDSREKSASRYIYCIGDSVTQGQSGIDNPRDDNLSNAAANCYPNRLQDMLGEKYVVKNLGVGGQNTGEVLARNGWLDLIVTTSFTLKGNGDNSFVCSGSQSSTSGVLVDSCANEPANYLMQQGTEDAIAQMAKCYILGIPCALSASSGDIYIKRLETVNYDLVIPVGTHITFCGNNGDGIYLLRVGTNDVLRMGANMNVANYIKKIKASIQQISGGKYIVMGMFHGYENSTTEQSKWGAMNEALSIEFGSRYIDGTGFITSKEAFSLLGITPTKDSNISTARSNQGVKSDEYCMEHGITPSSFWRSSYTSALQSVDKIHLNYDGYYLIAKMFYNKMKELNWI